MIAGQENLLRNKDFFLIVYRFNFYLLDYAKEEIIKDFFPNCPMSVLYKNEYTKKAFSQILLKKMDLEGKEFWNFDHVLAKVALLEEKTILKIIRLISACVFHLEIRKEIKREQVRNLIRSLGEEVYFFALKKAPFFIKEDNPLRNYLLDITKKEGKGVGEEFVGWKVLNMAFGQEDIALIKRLWLKIGPLFQPEESKFKNHAVRLIEKILIHEV